MDLLPHLLDFLRGERRPIARGQVVVELQMLGSRSAGAWPDAAPWEWDAAVDAGIASGAIEHLGHGKIRLAVVPVAKSERETQGELF